MKYHTRTIVLKLKLVADTKEMRDNHWKRIHQILNDSWKAANWIASGQFMNDQLIRRVYARKKIDPKDMDEVNKVEGEIFSKEGYFGTKRQATTERDIKQKFPDLPPCVTNPLNQVVFASYKAEKSDLLMGNRSLRTYRKGMPVVTTKTSVVIQQEKDSNFIVWKLGRHEQLRFEIYYGRDKANNKLTVKRILEGINDFSAPQFQYRNNRKAIFLLLPVKEPAVDRKLKSELSVGVDLGIAVPAYVAVSKGPQRRAIGYEDLFLKTRTQMQSRRRRLQRDITSARGGNGRKRKLKSLDQLKLKERNFAKSYNHHISKQVIDFALKNSAGVIKMELLEGFKEDERDNFILRNWSYFELQTMIEYKAKREGIEVVKIDPYHTSQICSSCGHYEENQRNGTSFVCAFPSCGTKLHADYNAALNIARSTKVVKKKTDCEYYKKEKAAGPTAEG